MNIINKTKKCLSREIEKIAYMNIIRKLKKQGIDHTQLSESDFNDLVAAEARILESDNKKVGVGIGIGLAISLLTGF